MSSIERPMVVSPGGEGKAGVSREGQVSGLWTRSRRLAVDSGRQGFRGRRAESGEESLEGWELQHLVLQDVQEMVSWRQIIIYSDTRCLT